jgi:hypothetical protein
LATFIISNRVVVTSFAGWWGQAKSAFGAVFESDTSDHANPYTLTGLADRYASGHLPPRQNPMIDPGQRSGNYGPGRQHAYSGTQGYSTHQRHQHEQQQITPQIPQQQQYPPQYERQQSTTHDGIMHDDLQRRYPNGYAPPQPRFDPPYPQSNVLPRQSPPQQNQFQLQHSQGLSPGYRVSHGQSPLQPRPQQQPQGYPSHTLKPPFQASLPQQEPYQSLEKSTDSAATVDPWQHPGLNPESF